jgi:hypothetical protein
MHNSGEIHDGVIAAQAATHGLNSGGTRQNIAALTLLHRLRREQIIATL